MPLYVYTIEQSKQWDDIVRSFRLYDVYYLSGYVKAFQLHGDGYPLLFYYTGENIRGINVVMKRDIADDPFFSDKINRNELFDFATPYGYAGWLIEGNGDRKALFSDYEKWCKGNNIVSEFVRYHPVIGNAETANLFYDVVMLGKTIAMDLSSPEVIWANLISQNRNKIRKAQKLGVTIHHGQSSEFYKEFRAIYDLTMDADKAKAYYYFEDEFFDSIHSEINNESEVFWAELDGKIIAISIMIFANEYMHYHLSGSLREYQSYAPSNLLLYEAALWGCRNGYKCLHLGGGVGSSEDGVYKFKSAFNRKETKQFAIGKKIYLLDVYENLVEMKKQCKEENYFPKYRA